MEYQINFGFHAFSVPSAVVDNLINFADGNNLKVLLYLLRYPDKHFSVGQVASALKLSREATEDAFDFWAKANILEEKIKEKPEKPAEEKQLELIPSVFSVSVPETAPEPVPEDSSRLSEKKLTPVKTLNRAHTGLTEFFSQETIREIMSGSRELQRLVRIVNEKYYSGTMNAVKLNSLVWMFSYLELPADVILILFQYCADVEKLSPNYMNKLAAAWYEEEILTAQAAQEKADALREFYTYKNYICRLFEISATTEAQREFIQLWQQWEFSEEMLRYARNLSVEATGKVNFKYIHAVLNEWNKNQITDIQEAKDKHDEYVRMIIANTKKGRKKKALVEHDDVKRQEMEEIDEYLSLVNRFEEGDTK